MDKPLSWTDSLRKEVDLKAIIQLDGTNAIENKFNAKFN